MHPIRSPRAQTLPRLRSQVRSIALAVALLVPLAVAAQQTTFATPEAAVDALQRAFQANDDKALLAIFGEKYSNLVGSGDPAYDAELRREALDSMGRRRTLEELGSDRRILLIGDKAWPFPVPIVREGVGWRFASEQGAEEVLNRRVGRSERNAIHVLRAYVDAQREYATKDRMGDGILQYARSLGSTPGRHDGLYWPSDESKGEERSPFGPLVAEASSELAGRKAGDPFEGYYFRILTHQGAHAAGGAYNYVINGHMVGGFGMVAYPAEWGRSGVMTFVVNQNGKIFEKNLGENTRAIAAGMQAFDPGPGWIEVPQEEP